MTLSLGKFTPNRPGPLNTALLRMALNGVHTAEQGDVFVVQVGANDGKMNDPIYPYFEACGWSGLLIEPLPNYFAKLTELHEVRKHITLENSAVGDAAGDLNLYHLNPAVEDQYPKWVLGCASSDEDRMINATKRAKGADARPSDVVGTKVPIVRLDSILDKHDVSQIDVLIIDVEGHEISVMNSFDMAAAGLSLAIVECNGPNEAQQDDYIACMTRAGLEVVRIGHDLVGMKPGALAVGLDEMYDFFGRGT